MSILGALFLLLTLGAETCRAEDQNPAASTESDTLVIGGDSDYPPYEFLDENGRPSGYNVEMTRALAKVLGRKVEIRLGPWAQIRQELESGRIDAVEGMFYSQERHKVVDFSQPHTIVDHTAFRRIGDPDVSSLNDLKGRALIVMEGDIMDDFVRENSLSDLVTRVRSQQDALRALASGQGDYALVARLPGLYWMRELELSNLELADYSVLSAPYCYAVTENNYDLLLRISEALAVLNETGEHARIRDKWLGILGDDLARLRKYAWYAGIVGILFISLAAANAVWSWTLKRRVNERTRELEAEVRERVRAEAALKLSENRFRAILEHFPNGAVFVFDKRMRFRFADGQGVRRYDGNPEEVVGRSLEEIFPAGIAGKLRPLFRATLEGHSSCLEAEYDGEDYELSSVPLFDEAGEVDAGLVVSQIVTRKKRMLEALKEREDRLATIFSTVQAGILLVDMETRVIVDVNPAAAKMIGLIPEKIKGRVCHEFACPSAKGKCPVEASGFVLDNSERVLLTADGRKIPILKNITTLNLDGRPHILESFVGIAELKKAQDEIARQQDLLTSLFDSMPDAIFVKDRAGICQGCNTAFAALLGVPREEIVGRSGVELFPAGSRSKVEALCAKVVELNRSETDEFSFEQPDGSVRVLEMTLSPYYWPRGEINGVLGVGRDITERRKLEQLKEDVRRITQHDLKLPLNGIIGLPQTMLDDDNLTGDQRETLSLLVESGYRMLRMINLSLDLYKMEQGIYHFTPEVVDVCEVVRNLAREFQGFIEAKNLRLTFAGPGNSGSGKRPVQVLGEKLLFTSLVSNLLKNALEASPPDQEVRVEIQGGDEVVLRIHNMGVVPPEVRETFFEKYATSGKDKGTGLGTYSARLMATTLGGAIDFTTSEAEGTTLIVRLPAVPAEAASGTTA